MTVLNELNETCVEPKLKRKFLIVSESNALRVGGGATAAGAGATAVAERIGGVVCV